MHRGNPKLIVARVTNVEHSMMRGAPVERVLFNPDDPLMVTWGGLSGFQPSYYKRRWCQGFLAPQAYTAPLLTLHQHRANNQ